MSLSVFIAAGMSVSFFLSYHVGNSASVSPVEFSKRPMSAVANYPFHTPISTQEFIKGIKNMFLQDFGEQRQNGNRPVIIRVLSTVSLV